ncbi:MAG: HNH endonuclease [Euryarchaeota archaeon]|nr:HNH endonuclease [Euryarchaeota archaeon]
MELRRRIAAVRRKRPRTVLEHVLKHGHITTEELKRLYGYNHPPRAARDVREEGIPLKTFFVTGPDGRRIAAYRLDEAARAMESQAGGRRAFPKALKTSLLRRDGAWCALCGARFPEGALQIDHRIPYEVAGEEGMEGASGFMLVCGSCNRAKSWSCEACRNWKEFKKVSVCGSCFWASPKEYSHIAMEERRSLTLTWHGPETEDYDRVKAEAMRRRQSVQEFAKHLLRR